MEPAVIAPPVAQEEERAQEGAEEVEVLQPEEQVATEQDPADPAGQPGSSTDPTPGTSASTGAAEIVAYMNKCQGLAKTWIEEVVEKKEQAYHDLIDGLVNLVEEQSKIKDLKVGVVGLSDEDIDSVLESIPDMSGKYIDTIGRLQVEVLKEEEEITRKRFTESKKASEQQKALNEYYDAVKDLCHSQAVYMARLEKLSKVLDDPDKLLAIINHVQLPAIQVTVTTKEQDKKQVGLSGEEMVITQHLPNVDSWKVGHQTGVKMMAGWLYFVLYKQVTGSTAGQDKCAEKFHCSTTQFKRLITGKWQEGGKRKEETKSVSEAKKKRKSKRLEEIAEQERGMKREKKAKRAKVVHLRDDDDDDEEDED